MRVAEASQVTRLEAALAAERERNHRLEDLLRNLADHDPLTDLLNRRTIEREVEEHQIRCARYGPEGALLLMGLDGLGEVARAGGQTASDEALSRLAQLVVDRLRATDVVGRWGPEELAVLLPRASVADVAIVADALVGIVGAIDVPGFGTLAGSIGVALVVTAPSGVDPLVAQAARALATARRRGGGWALGEG